MRGFVVAILLAATFLPAAASAQSYGTESPFVLGTGARVPALGVAGVTLYGDATVQYYNPAGLTGLQYKEFAFFRTRLFDSESVYHTFSYAHPLLHHGTLAISLLRLDVGGIEQRDINNQLLSDDLSNSQTRVMLGYSRPITAAVSAGANFKIDNHSFGSFSGSGVGVDVGLSAMQPGRFGRYITGFRQGLVIHNLIAPSIKLDQESVPDPMQIGVGFSALSAYGPATMVTTIDLVNPRYSPTTVRFGQEVTYAENYSLRFGIDRSTPTFGFGAEYKAVTFDYAFRNEDIGSNHRFALTIKFGSSISERKAAERLRLEQAVNDQLNDRMFELERSQITNAIAAGDSLFHEGDFELALAEYDKALLWDPGNEHAQEYAKRSRLRQLIEQGRHAVAGANYVQGLVFARQALDIAPADATAQAMADKCEREIAAAENSAELAEELLRRAIDLYAEGDYLSALNGFEEVLKMMPTNALANEYRDKSQANIDATIASEMRDGRRAVGRSQFDAAIEHFDRVLSLNPENTEARAERSQAIAKREAAIQAEQEAGSLITTPPPAPAAKPKANVNPALLEEKYNAGMGYFEDGDFKAAADAFFEVWKLSPDYHNVSTFLTKAYLFMGMQHYTDQNYADAIAIWKRALEVDPDNAKAKRYLEKADEEFSKLKRASNE